MAEVVQTISDIREFIQSYGTGETFKVTESTHFPATFSFQLLPRLVPVLDSFLYSQVALDFSEVQYFFQYMAAEFLDLPLKYWQELAPALTQLSAELSKRIRSLAHNDSFTYCSSYQVCRGLPG